MARVPRSAASTAASESTSTSSRPVTPDSDTNAGGSEPAGSQTPSVWTSSPPLSPYSTRSSVADGLGYGIRRMRLSSPTPEALEAPATPGTANYLGMSALVAATEVVERGGDEQTPIAETPPATPGGLMPPRSARSSRSRSSSPRTRSERYNSADEKLPEHQLYSSAVRRALRDSKALMAGLADVLGSSRSGMHEDGGSTVHRLHQKATALANFQCPPTWTVGFVGATGAGKSSLLNSLLDKQDLAMETSDGSACTSVATEFRYRAGDGFAIDVELYREDELQQQVAQLLRTYRSYHLADQEATRARNTGPQSVRDAEAETIQVAMEDADNALSKLRTLFGDQLDSAQLLRADSADAEERVLAVLRPQLLANRARLPSRQEFFTSASSCSRRLRALTVEVRKNATRRPSDWFYIRVIKVFLNAPILSRGLILVDLPGLGDVNIAREAVTERHLLQCDEIFAVCPIGRACSDAGVDRVVNLGRLANLSNICVVCTKSEDFGGDKIKKSGPGARRIQGLAQEVAGLLDDKATLDRWLKGNYYDGEEVLTAEELLQEVRANSLLLEINEFDLLKQRVKVRNAVIGREIKKVYQNKIPNGIQHVFGVSNTKYWKFREAPRDEFLPWLSLSGILKLRTYCLSKVADSQLVAVTKYIRESIPALLGDVELWLRSGTDSDDEDQKRAVREVIRRVETDLRGTLRGRDSVADNMRASMDAVFVTKISNNYHPVRWAAAALVTAELWYTRWHAQTYIAFCRNWGEHTTGKAGWHSWNKEAMESMVADLQGPWIELRTTLINENNEKIVMTENFIDGRIQELDEVAPVALSWTLRSHNTAFVSEIRSCINNFANALDTLRTMALSGMRTAAFGTAMESTYIEAANLKGKGCTRAKAEIMDAALGDPDLFDRVGRDIRDEFSKLARGLQDDMQAAVAKYLDAVRVTFDMVRSAVVATESATDRRFAARVSATLAAGKLDMARLKDLFPPIRRNEDDDY